MKKVNIKLDDARDMVVKLNLDQAMRIQKMVNVHINNMKATIQKDYHIGEKVALIGRLDLLENGVGNARQGIVCNIDNVKYGKVKILSKGKMFDISGSYLMQLDKPLYYGSPI